MFSKLINLPNKHPVSFSRIVGPRLPFIILYPSISQQLSVDSLMISRFQVQLPNPTCNSGGRWRPPTGSKLTAPVTTIGGKVGQFWRIPGAQPGKPHTIQKESWIRRYQGDISKHVQGNALDGLCDVFVFNRQSIEQQHMMKLPTKTVIKQVVMNKCLSCSKFAFFPMFFCWGEGQSTWLKSNKKQQLATLICLNSNSRTGLVKKLVQTIGPAGFQTPFTRVGGTCSHSRVGWTMRTSRAPVSKWFRW